MTNQEIDKLNGSITGIDGHMYFYNRTITPKEVSYLFNLGKHATYYRKWPIGFDGEKILYSYVPLHEMTDDEYVTLKDKSGIYHTNETP